MIPPSFTPQVQALIAKLNEKARSCQIAANTTGLRGSELIAVRDTLADAARLLSSLPQRGWQPIATAPKDGTTFLAHDRVMGVLVVRHRNEHDAYDPQGTNWYMCWDGTQLAEAPEFWMPLPAPPVDPETT